jgi:hypothetical protein
VDVPDGALQDALVDREPLRQVLDLQQRVAAHLGRRDGLGSRLAHTATVRNLA